VNVSVAKPVVRQIKDVDEFTGRTEAVGFVEVRARVGGYLQKVAFKDGAEVKAGDVLFEIDPRPYQAELDRAQAKRTADEAKLRELSAVYARNKILHDRRALSLEELQESEAARDVVAANIAADKAEIDTAKLDLEFSRVIAPVAGRVSRAEVREGNLIAAQVTGSPILTTIVPQSPIYVYFDVDERRFLEYLKNMSSRETTLDKISEAGLKVRLSLADNADFPFEGVVDFADNKVSATTGTLRVRAVFDNTKRLMAPGMFARLRIDSRESHEALLIPDIAVLTDQGLKYVWVVDDKGVVARRDIRLGKSTQGVREVMGGLNATDTVIVVGIQRVREGATVIPKTIAFDDFGRVVPEAAAKPGAEAKNSPETPGEPAPRPMPN
jgi:RND family efflux transporter MFP subunit